MVELLTLVYNKLLEVHSNVFFDEANGEAVFPCVIYRIPNSTMREYREDFILEVDIYDSNTDTTQLETITDNISDKLNRFYHIDENMQVSIYKISRLMIPEPDSSINRRQLRFQIKTYWR